MRSRLMVFLLIFSILTALSIPFSAIPSEDEAAIYDNVIRLHILASSDSEADQELKLKVRDSLLRSAARAVEGCDTFETARSALEDSLETLCLDAANTIEREGFDYEVEITLTREVYPTRKYRGVTLPSGEYTSLRVLIGEASGKNWWCVLFPQLCVSTATGEAADLMIIDDTEPMLEAGLTSGQIELITGESPRVCVKLKLLEWISALRERFRG